MSRFPSFPLSLTLVASCLAAQTVNVWAVEFPGPNVGVAHSAQKNGVYTLSNGVLSLAWHLSNGQLRLSNVTNRLNGRKTLSGERDVFRLSTNAATVAPVRDSFMLGWKLDAKNITAVYGDGKAWRTLKSFSRSQFPGVPKFVRYGKMSLKADATDYSEPGAIGTTRLEAISLAGQGGSSVVASNNPNTKVDYQNGTLKITANANTTAFVQYPVQNEPSLVSARVWKESDGGESWGPGVAVVWPNGKFALLNARTPLGEFSIATQDGETLLTSLPPTPAEYDLPASAFRLIGAPQLKTVKGAKELVAQFRHATQPLTVEWKATLRDNAHYVRQSVTVKASGSAGMLSNVELVDFPVPNTEQVGSVPGSPIAGNNWFFGAELPVASNDVADDARSSIACKLPLEAGASYSFGSVVGVYPNGQLRRSLLAYIERERARPTKPFLHYNCWYDLAQQVNEKDLNTAIAQFHNELTVKRGVQVDSYVIDDGWDDSKNTFWGVDSKKFPDGFKLVADQLKTFDSHLGLWISPLGGYGEAQMRTDNARKIGLVENGKGLDLSYPPYYNWFRDKHLQFIRDYQVNYFKWDKAGDGVNPHFMALLRVANELRRVKPDLFINVTVGTWPSPFWLNHIDSTWRSGYDVGFIGKGNRREQWLNYRDGDIYSRVVKLAPLYPLNSIMHHGITIGRYYQGKDIAVAGTDLKHDARSYFATGATLQELYLTPSLMSKEGWDAVAEAAKWSKQNADVLADSHWIGGDPRNEEVYGYASWAPRKGVFMLRNPSDKTGSIALDAATLFELPANAKRTYALSSPYADQRIKSGELKAGTPTTFTLEPFEVLVFDALPR